MWRDTGSMCRRACLAGCVDVNGQLWSCFSPACLCEFWRWNSGCQACVATPLPTEPSRWSFLIRVHPEVIGRSHEWPCAMIIWEYCTVTIGYCFTPDSLLSLNTHKSEHRAFWMKHLCAFTRTCGVWFALCYPSQFSDSSKPASVSKGSSSIGKRCALCLPCHLGVSPNTLFWGFIFLFVKMKVVNTSDLDGYFF